jgi:hypothetical protein
VVTGVVEERATVVFGFQGGMQHKRKGEKTVMR